MSQYDEVLSKVLKYSEEKSRHLHLLLPDDPIRKSAGSSRYFAGLSGAALTMPPGFLYFRSLLTPTFWTVAEKKHLVELVTTQLRENGNVDWQRVSESLKAKSKKTPMECLVSVCALLTSVGLNVCLLLDAVSQRL